MFIEHKGGKGSTQHIYPTVMGFETGLNAIVTADKARRAAANRCWPADAISHGPWNSFLGGVLIIHMHQTLPIGLIWPLISACISAQHGKTLLGVTR
jgi:hypothetical protein